MCIWQYSFYTLNYTNNTANIGNVKVVMSGRNQVRLKGKIHLKLFKIILSSLQFKAYTPGALRHNYPLNMYFTPTPTS